MARKQRASTTHIVVHCLETYADQDVGVVAVDRWHRAKGWDGCGYHAVIRRSGVLDLGRPWNEYGAHVLGHNATAVGVALAGGLQWVQSIEEIRPDEAECPARETCAGFLDPKKRPTIAKRDATGGPGKKHGVAIFSANFTPLQLRTLDGVLDMLQHKYPGAVVIGHRELAKDRRPCPTFSVADWLANGRPSTVSTNLL